MNYKQETVEVYICQNCGHKSFSIEQAEKHQEVCQINLLKETKKKEKQRIREITNLNLLESNIRDFIKTYYGGLYSNQGLEGMPLVELSLKTDGYRKYYRFELIVHPVVRGMFDYTKFKLYEELLKNKISFEDFEKLGEELPEYKGLKLLMEDFENKREELRKQLEETSTKRDEIIRQVVLKEVMKKVENDSANV